MLFTSFEFACFFLVVLALNWTLRRRSGPYRIFLLAANIIFYASLDVRFLLLPLAVGVVNWAAAVIMARMPDPAARRRVLWGYVTLNLGLLAFFKYFEFFYSGIESLFLTLGFSFNLPLAEIIFPVGISFFTFQAIGYAIDVYRDPGQAEPSLLNTMIFITFFPTILSGPILRARQFLPQLKESPLDPAAFQEGFALILSGLFKKIVIASYLSEHIVRQVFQVPDGYSSWTVLAAIYGYSVQIYCDFSGYSDLAIGLALLLGYDIPDNFRDPYRVTNLVDFWHRWHISLSTWLRDYLYISLGGNRKGTARKYINLMLTMVLGGLWHGAHARFLLWGALHGLGITLTHIWRDRRSARTPSWEKGMRRQQEGQHPWRQAAGPAACWFLTFTAVSFLWVFFRAEDATRAFEIFKTALSFGHPGAGLEPLVVAAIVVGVGLQFVSRHVYDAYIFVQERLPLPAQALVISVLTVIILRMGPEGVLPFIYFQF